MPIVATAERAYATCMLSSANPAKRPIDGYGERDHQNPQIQIRLLTFGNPIRQLVNRFFSVNEC
jgi:hypothetical protein